MPAAKKSTHVVHVHPKNGIALPGGLGHRKHGRHEIAPTEEQLMLLADALGIDVKTIEEDAKGGKPEPKKGEGE